MYIVVTEHIKCDGTSDIYAELQALIDKYPNRTIFFPDGTYPISKPICTPANPSKSVHLVLANYAVIRPCIPWGEDYGALIKLGGKDAYNSITINGSNYGIEGGIIDGLGVADGISIDSGRETKITKVSIKNTKVGIHIKHGANNGSSDADVVDVNIVGNDNTNSVGVLLEGYDNTLTNMRIASVNKGVWCKSGGNSLKNIHPLYIFKSTQDYPSSVGFQIEGGNNFLDYCYSDQFATGFKLTASQSVNLTDCFCWWYNGDVASQTAIYCGGVCNAFVNGLHVGFSAACKTVTLLQASKGGKGVLRDIDCNRTDLSSFDVSESYLAK